MHSRDSLVVFFRIIPKQIGRFWRERPYARSMIGMVKVFRYSFSEAIPLFFIRLKGGFFFVRSLYIKFLPVIGYGLKFVKM